VARDQVARVGLATSSKHNMKHPLIPMEPEVSGKPEGLTSETKFLAIQILLAQSNRSLIG
jgi:hypothetical protein